MVASRVGPALGDGDGAMVVSRLGPGLGAGVVVALTGGRMPGPYRVVKSGGGTGSFVKVRTGTSAGRALHSNASPTKSTSKNGTGLEKATLWRRVPAAKENHSRIGRTSHFGSQSRQQSNSCQTNHHRRSAERSFARKRKAKNERVGKRSGDWQSHATGRR